MLKGRYRWLLLFVGFVFFGVCARADDPLNYATQSLDPQKLYDTDTDAERVDLFRCSLHLQHTDVHLPGKYGLDVNVVRWYDSKISDTATSTGGTCQVFDYGQETGEVLGYGWRLHMGRFIQQLNPVIPSPGVAAPNPADYLELPGGHRIAFYTSADSALFPNSNPAGQRTGVEFWWATYPVTTSDPLVVHAPDGTIYEFNPSAQYSAGANTVIWNVTTIQRGDASISIQYDVTPQYAYITSITDTYGRQVTFHYYNANDPSQLVNPLYEIDFPVAGTTGSVKYYYINPSSSPVTQDSTSNPVFTMPTLSALTSPAPRSKTYGPPYFILGQVVPPAGTAFATSYNYFLDAGGGGALAGNQMACIQYPNGTVSAYAYAFISRGDFPGQSCYLAISARGKKGSLVAGRTSPAPEVRRWTYGYSVAGSGNTSQFKAQVDTPEPVRQIYYFNPFLPLSGVSCSTGNCPSNNNWQRWRVGLLLKEETWDTSGSPVKLEDRTYTYAHAVYDSQRFPYVISAAFVEHGFTPVLAAQTETLYLSGGQLQKTTTFSSFDQYGNPQQKVETGYSGSTLRSTSVTYAWAGDSTLKNEWVIRAPQEETLENGSGVTLADTYRDYYNDANHPGFPSMLRHWVSDDGTGTQYWSGEDYAYSSSGNQDTVTTTVGHATSPTGSLTADRKIIETKDHGTPLSRKVQGPSGSPSIQVYTRTLDSNYLAPATETVDGTTRFNYDSAGRLSSVTPPAFADYSGTVTAQATAITYTAKPPQVELLVGASLERTDYDFDGFGNLASKRMVFATAQTAHEDTGVDALSRATDRYVPYFNVGDKGKVTTTYDALGRPLTVTAYRANGTQESQTSYAYTADTSVDCVHVTITRPASAASGTVQTEEWYDSDGNLTKLLDDANNTVYYTYDPLDHLTEIQDGSQTRTFTYASTGQLLTSMLPESGTTHLVYDHAGNLIKRTFADNSRIQYTPDFAGRVTQILFDDNSKVRNVYDAYPGGCSGPSANPANHLLYQANLDPTGNVIRSLCNSYDSHGRLFRQITTVDNTAFTVGYDYNDRGELGQITYPSGQAVQASGFNYAGLPAQLGNGSTPFVSSLQYGPDKNLLGYDAGASAWTATDDTFNRPATLTFKKSATTLYQSALSYFPSGNLSSQSHGDPQGLGTLNVAYQYDDLHRLTGETLTGAVTGSLGYGYDVYGNLQSRTAAGGIPNASALALSRSYHPSTNQDASVGYDGRGNVMQDGPYTYTMNALNLAATASKTGGGSFTYAYDPAGRRVRTSWTDAQGNHVGYAFYDGAGELLSEMESLNGGAITPKRDYVYASGRLVAILNFAPYSSPCTASPVAAGRSRRWGMTSGGTQAAGVETFWAMAWDQYVPNVDPADYRTPEAVAEASLTYEYPVLDVTGSPRMWVDNQGNVLSRSFAGPYGEDLGFYHDQPFTKLGFASLQDEHQDAGVFYTPNRYLGTAARFISADPSGSFNVHDPRTLNQYAYTSECPLLFMDPAGLGWGEDFADWVDARVDQAVGAVSNTNASAMDYAAAGMLGDAVKMAADTFRLGDGAYASYDAASRGDYVGAAEGALQDVGRASNIMLGVGLAGKTLQALSEGTKLGDMLNAPLSQLAKGGEAERSIGATRGASSLVEQGSTAVLKDGYYEVNGFKFSEYYYNKLWDTGRGAPSLVAREVLQSATEATPDIVKQGFFRYEYGGWEMIHNPATKEVWHLQPIQ